MGLGASTISGALVAHSRTLEQAQQRVMVRVELKRPMEQEGLLGAVNHLASRSASATTGHLLIIDGTITARLSSYASRREI